MSHEHRVRKYFSRLSAIMRIILQCLVTYKNGRKWIFPITMRFCLELLKTDVYVD